MKPARLVLCCVVLVVIFTGALGVMNHQVTEDRKARAEQDCAYRNYSRDLIRAALVYTADFWGAQRDPDKFAAFQAGLLDKYPAVPCAAAPNPQPPAP